MQRLFGTDGIRGTAGEFPLDVVTVSQIGYSVTARFREALGRSPKFVIGRDTRESGGSLENAFCSGVDAAGGTIESAGVITTPGVAFVTREFEFDAGIVVSASHNPFQDNGLKVFLPSGKKMDGNLERAIESDIAEGIAVGDITASRLISHSARVDEFCDAYVEHLKALANGRDLSGLKLSLDCANGAAATIAPRVFRELGATVVAINDAPDGRNINKDCGSLHLESLQETTRKDNAHLGIAFDGDADRSLFVDENGAVVDGDAVLFVLADFFRSRGELRDATVVATVMSNIGLELGLAEKGIKLVRTSVGDKYVLEELLKSGAELGGEQSGHIILPRESLVGDGIATALFVIDAMLDSGSPLSRLTAGFVRYPQVLLNVKVREKQPFESLARIDELRTDVERQLAGNGRLLLRYSGTENLARVMIEGKDQASIDAQARQLAAAIESELG